MAFVRSVRDESLCRRCGFCEEVSICPATNGCIGCLACYRGCPHQARRLVPDERERKKITIKVDGVPVQVYECTTVRRALESVGVTFGRFPDEGRIFAP